MPRQKSATSATVPLALKIAPDLDQRLRAFAEESNLRRGEAARLLLLAGLDAITVPKEHGPVPLVEVLAKDCVHPISRRLGKTCMICGRQVVR